MLGNSHTSHVPNMSKLTTSSLVATLYNALVRVGEHGSYTGLLHRKLMSENPI